MKENTSMQYNKYFSFKCFQKGEATFLLGTVGGYTILIYTVTPTAPSTWHGLSTHFLKWIATRQAEGASVSRKPLRLWVSNRGEQQPCWHTTLLAKSSVLYLCRKAAAFRILRAIPDTQTSLYVPTKGAGRCVAKRDAPPGISAVWQRYIKFPFPRQRSSRGMLCDSVLLLFQIVPPHRLQGCLVRGFSAGS